MQQTSIGVLYVRTLLRIEIMKYNFSTQKHFTRIKCIATEMIASSLGNVYIYIFYSAWTM
jgi:hypothetical protein